MYFVTYKVDVSHNSYYDGAELSSAGAQRVIGTCDGVVIIEMVKYVNSEWELEKFVPLEIGADLKSVEGYITCYRAVVDLINNLNDGVGINHTARIESEV